MAVMPENTILFDWLSFTTKIDDLAGVIYMLGLLDVPFQDMRGAQGYRSRKYFQGINIHYDRDDGTVWVEMSGTGCRAYETYSTNCDWNNLFRLFISDPDSYHVSRLDVAYDDFKKLLVLKRIWKYLENDYVITKFRDCGIERYSFRKGNLTVFLGSKQSDCYVRIYNKKVEQGRDDLEHWVRWEYQFRDDHAIGFISEYLSHNCDIGYTFLGVTNHYIRFLEPAPTKKYNWKNAKWWDRFICDVDKIKVFTPHTIEYNEAKMQEYVFGQAGQAINCAVELYGLDGFYDYLQSYLDDHKQSVNPKYQDLLDNLCGTPF